MDKTIEFLKMLVRRLRQYGLKTFSSYIISEVRGKIENKLMSSFSQTNEDLEIDKLLGHKKKGFYVDVGANDPSRFSNTKRFYSRGWRGINIEPNTSCYLKFVKDRPRDINLNIGIGNKNGKLIFNQFDPDTLSTFSPKQTREYIKDGYSLIKKYKIPVRSLKSVLNRYAKNKRIDFLSIDTEGFDFEVLKGNDWKKFKPEIICIESVEKNAETKKIKKYLISKGYKRKYNNYVNSIYMVE